MVLQHSNLLQKSGGLFVKFFILSTLLLRVSISASRCAEGAPKTPGETAYKISSQPIDLALKAFATTSGMQVLYETELTAGRRSAPVIGVFEAGAALRALLAGSGLVGMRTDVDAFSIAVVRPQQAEKPLEPNPHFLGALQTGILDSLCRTPITAPGAYRVALQLWITPAGTVRRAQLLGTTGEPRRDQAIAAELQNVSLSMPPSDHVPQPITLVIGPRQPLAGDECSDR